MCENVLHERNLTELLPVLFCVQLKLLLSWFFLPSPGCEFCTSICISLLRVGAILHPHDPDERRLSARVLRDPTASEETLRPGCGQQQRREAANEEQHQGSHHYPDHPINILNWLAAGRDKLCTCLPRLSRAIDHLTVHPAAGEYCDEFAHCPQVPYRSGDLYGAHCGSPHGHQTFPR